MDYIQYAGIQTGPKLVRFISLAGENVIDPIRVDSLTQIGHLVNPVEYRVVYNSTILAQDEVVGNFPENDITFTVVRCANDTED
jgi:hypothetical protein